jgi:outer membrane lipoprotein LolB
MLRYLVLLAACCFITACATPNFDRTLAQPDWEISGKIGIKESASRASSSLFQWRQKNDNYAIFLFNALGQTQITITGNKKKAIAQQADGSTASAKTPEELLNKLTGWHFPVSSARFWLQGTTEGSESAIKRSNDGNIAQLTATQWQVTLNNYKLINGKPMPHKLKLQQENLHITLIVKEHVYSNP